MKDKEIIDETLEQCGGCEAWSGSDCTRNPYTQGCLRGYGEDKQKQIEEIAKIMCLFCKEMTEEKECERGKECFDWRLKEASFYYEQGCRHYTHEDSVVISKAKYEMLVACSSYEGVIGKLKDEYIRGSKETAEKILKLVKEKSWCYQEDENGRAWTYSITVTQLKEIAKQFGVEIKE